MCHYFNVYFQGQRVKLTLHTEYFPQIYFRLQAHVSEPQCILHRAKIQKVFKDAHFYAQNNFFHNSMYC